MSNRWLTFHFENGHTQINKRMVLLTIADIADDAGYAYPSVATIAKRSCLSVRQVRRLLRELEAEGWLRTVENRGRKLSGTYVTNDYYLQKPDSIVSGLPASEASLPDEHKPDTQGIETGHAGYQDRTSEASKPDIAMSDKPSANPQQSPTEPCAMPLQKRATPTGTLANEIIAGFRTQLYAGNGLPADQIMFAQLVRLVGYAEAKRQIAILRDEEVEVARMMQPIPAGSK